MAYLYKPPPTGAKFLNSCKFVKVIMGPVGSGLAAYKPLAAGKGWKHVHS